MIYWTETIEGIKIPHGKQKYPDCDNGKIFSDCVIKPENDCSNCGMQRACTRCLDQIGEMKTYSTSFNMLKRNPGNDYHQMLSYCEGEYERRQKMIRLETARGISMRVDNKNVVKRRFQRINIMMDCKSYIKSKIFPKTNRFLFMDSNILKQMKSMIIFYSDASQINYMKIIIYSTSGLIN